MINNILKLMFVINISDVSSPWKKNYVELDFLYQKRLYLKSPSNVLFRI